MNTKNRVSVAAGRRYEMARSGDRFLGMLERNGLTDAAPDAPLERGRRNAA
ncbi:hypothetical protein [Thermogemmatispora sp.]|uniref:hypothetical protein n=1 Tax=Thermogemmatispora sp. TaxID=1968838 RepID=UPI0035E453A6